MNSISSNSKAPATTETQSSISSMKDSMVNSVTSMAGKLTTSVSLYETTRGLHTTSLLNAPMVNG